MSTTVWILILAAVLGTMLTIVLRQRRSIRELTRQLEDLRGRINAVTHTRPALTRMAEYLEDDETHQLIRHRYHLSSELFAAVVSNDAARINAAMREIEHTVEEPADFMRQLRLLYARLQPRMMDQLQECGLTDRETEICCLYALGLNGKTIQQYTHDGRHFQKVGAIRKKLGLGEHDRNIDGYIRSLLK